MQISASIILYVRATNLDDLVHIDKTSIVYYLLQIPPFGQSNICVLFTAEFPMEREHNLNEGSSLSARVKYNHFHFLFMFLYFLCLIPL